jgi:hypothetical protein
VDRLLSVAEAEGDLADTVMDDQDELGVSASGIEILDCGLIVGRRGDEDCAVVHIAQTFLMFAANFDSSHQQIAHK